MEEEKKQMPAGKPWQKGQSGNPKGRPKNEASITAMLRKQLDIVPDFTLDDGSKNTKTWTELIVRAILWNVVEGDSRITKELLNRLEGKVTDDLRISEVEPIKTIIVNMPKESEKGDLQGQRGTPREGSNNQRTEE